MAHVLLDCDGPLANFALAYFHEALRVVARTRPPGAPFARSVADIGEWDLARGLGLTDEERALVVAEIHRPGWVSSVSRMPGAAPGVRALREAGHEIHFVTSPWPGHATWMHERAEWLARHFDARHDEITFTHRKDHYRGEVFVDDKIEHVEAWVRASVAARVQRFGALLWDLPLNRGASAPGVQRTDSWKRVLAIADMIDV